MLIADCGHAGAQILDTEPVDLVVTDMIVIVLSALAQGDEVESGLAAGAGAYLTKPFSPAKLLSTIARLLPRTASER